ncbi:MAG: FecR domain-containing protein, partial [Polyangiaceae bacterium]
MNPDELIDRMAELARGAAGGGASAIDPGGLQRLERALARGSARSATRRFATGVGLVAVAAALSVALWLRTRVLTFVVVHARSASGDYVVAEEEGTALRFSDESEIAMATGSRVRVQQVEARGARLMLEGGAVHVRIQPRPRAAWAIDAGPYVVRVTGTEFDLSWKADEQTLDLALHRGSVTVEGPLADGSVHMVAGQHLRARAREGAVSVEALGEAPGGPAASPSASAPPAENAMARDAPEHRSPGAGGEQATPSSSPRAAAPAGSGWSSRLAHGEFRAILDDAQRRGLDATLAEAPLADLAALADAARYSRRVDVAVPALSAERRRFAASAQAHDASFFLAGLAEGSG